MFTVQHCLAGAENMWYRSKREFVKTAGSFAAKWDFLQNYVHTRIYLSIYFCPGLKTFREHKNKAEDYHELINPLIQHASLKCSV